MKELIGNLPPLVDNFVGNILSYAVLLAAVATITMTFLELLKGLFKIRMYYHKSQVKKWLDDNKCFNELLILTVARIHSADALFDQPITKVMGQIQAAANVAVDFPELYPFFYKFLTEIPRSEAAVRETGERGTTGTTEGASDAEVWLKFMQSTERHAGEKLPDGVVQQATRARARIDHFVARKLDAFQTTTGYYWAKSNQFASVAISAAFITTLLCYNHASFGVALALGFFGGMIAPFAKDVVSGLSGVKTR